MSLSTSVQGANYEYHTLLPLTTPNVSLAVRQHLQLFSLPHLTNNPTIWYR